MGHWRHIAKGLFFAAKSSAFGNYIVSVLAYLGFRSHLGRLFGRPTVRDVVTLATHLAAGTGYCCYSAWSRLNIG